MSERTFPIRFDLTGEDAIIQGATWRRHFSFIFDDGTLWDTAGFTARMKVRATMDGPVLLDMNIGTGRLETGIRGTAPNQYNLAMILTPDYTSPLVDWGLGVYDVELTDLSARVYRVLEGFCALSREVTR